MQLRYTNPAAKTEDIQIPAIQVAPMVYNGVYTVVEALGLILLTFPHWERATPISTDGTTSVGIPELRRVKGIGAKTEAALASRGIGSLSILVGTSAEDIDALLDGSLDYVTVETILTWQEHARQLMEE